MIASYRIRKEGDGSFYLRFRLSDDPGLTQIFGLSEAKVRSELRALSSLGYELNSEIICEFSFDANPQST
jgi:hypothetical protein